MTPLREGRVQRLDESTEAIYLFGVADRADADRTPGWYLRRRMAGEAATIEAGPFASLEEASRHHLGPPAWTHGVRQTPEEILAEATLVRTEYRDRPVTSPKAKHQLDWAALRLQYEQGATTYDLVTLTGIDRKTLTAYLRSVGTTIRTGGARKRSKNPHSGPLPRVRLCTVCGRTKDRIVKTDPDTCRSCWSKARRGTRAYKAWYLKRQYGLDIVEYDRLMSVQEERCAVCRCPIAMFGKDVNLGVVDHDHTTHVVRGLLCDSCNVAIGLLEDSADRLTDAQQYLLRHHARIDPTAILYYPCHLLKPEMIAVGARTRIDSFCKIEGGAGVTIGEGVHVASFAHLNVGGGEFIAEDGSSFGSGAKVMSGSSIQTAITGCSPLDPATRIARSFAWVKKNATLYAGAIMLPGCVLGEGSVLAAGAVLKANTLVGPHELWAGTPATFKKRID